MTRRSAAAILTTLTAGLVCAPTLWAQTRPAPPLPNGSDNDVRLMNVTLRDLISQAYQLAAPQQVLGPAWLGGIVLKLVGEVPAGTGRDQIPHLLQIMLAKRYKLAVHPDQRAMQVILLEVAPGGPKLDPTPAWIRPGELQLAGTGPGRPSERGSNAPGPVAPGSVVPASSLEGSCENRRASEFRPAGEVCQAMSMPELALQLHRENFRFPPILDRTGLKGFYDFTLPSQSNFNASESLTAFIFTVQSLKDQLKSVGLTIEQRKETVEVVVVDHCEKKPVKE